MENDTVQRRYRRGDELLVMITDVRTSCEPIKVLAQRWGVTTKYVSGVRTGQHYGDRGPAPLPARRILRLNNDQVRAVRQAVCDGESRRSAAARLGANEGYIGQLALGRLRPDAGGALSSLRPTAPRSEWMSLAEQADESTLPASARSYILTAGRNWAEGVCTRCSELRPVRSGVCGPCGTRRTPLPPLQPAERSVLVGLMLGDGSLDPTGCLRIQRQARHVEYAEWIARMLPTLGLHLEVRPVIDRRRRHTVNWTVCSLSRVHPELKALRQRWYPSGTKIVPEGIEDELDDLALAVWFGDDGYADSSGGGMATDGIHPRRV